MNHTGPLLWVQRAWAGVLFCWPAALSHESALRAAQGPGNLRLSESTIDVAVDRNRHLVGPAGIKVHRVNDLRHQVQWNLGPPRVRYEQAVLDVAAGHHAELDAIATLAQACQSRRTTAQRLLTNLDQRTNLPRRSWLISILQDVADGACSVLEHGFLNQVVKAHGIALPQLQAKALVAGRISYRDAQWPGFLVVELDGRLFHDSTEQRERDFDRDLAAAAQGHQAVRLSYGQVFGRPCATAQQLVEILELAGVNLRPHPCGPECPFNQ